MKNGTFCNMCFKAGKPASDYKSHNGAVVCPHLLSTECRYCHEMGHALTGCPVLKRKNEMLKKYAVSGLPPMPTLLRPLVMPTAKLVAVPAVMRPLVMPNAKLVAVPAVMPTAKLVTVPVVMRPLVMPTAKLVAVPLVMRSLVMPTTKRKAEVLVSEDESDDESDDESAIKVSEMGVTNLINKRMRWVDMCDTDEEEDF